METLNQIVQLNYIQTSRETETDKERNIYCKRKTDRIKDTEKRCLLKFNKIIFQILFKKGVPLLMPNKSGARGIHTAAAKEFAKIIS